MRARRRLGHGSVATPMRGFDATAAALRVAGCVFAEDEAALLRESAPDVSELERMVAARCAGQPLEIVLGWAELGGIRFAVEPGVFVPRRRTEFLVELGRALAPAAKSASATNNNWAT